ncbi:hypothetical protein [Ureibacillus sp. FSL E2-3493]|uniref:hypothetical protein n=1 Tax=Ureibacillus sp. FSL E2-3493 TaxID=2921367 RepID=UPI003119F993
MKQSKKLYTYFLKALGIGAILAFIIKLSIVPLYSKSIEADVSATLISGILGMFGGAIGALSAYFIARMQMTKQLDLQYKKEEEKMIKEIKINNWLKLSENCYSLLSILSKLQKSLIDYGNNSILSKDKIIIIECENMIDEQIRELVDQTRKIIIYNVFFDDDIIHKFDNITKDLDILTDEVPLFLNYYKNLEVEFEDLKDIDKRVSLSREMREKVGKILSKSNENIIDILVYTNTYLERFINSES